MAFEAQSHSHDLVEAGKLGTWLAMLTRKQTEEQKVTCLNLPRKSAAEPDGPCRSFYPQSRVTDHITRGLVRPGPEQRDLMPPHKSLLVPTHGKAVASGRQGSSPLNHRL